MAIYNGGLNIVAQDISGKEDKSNKVTAWSSTTTDAHYPSEKLVKDALDGKAEKSEIATSVTTDSLTAGAILPKGSADIGLEKSWFNNVYANRLYSDTLYVNNFSFQSRVASQKPLFAGNSYPAQIGYIKCISVKVIYTYANAPIRWRINQRGFSGSFDIVLLLDGYDHAEAGIHKFRIINAPYTPPEAYAVVADATTIDIYIKKTEHYDDISVINCECPKYLENTVQISYPFTLAESVPSGAVRADCPAYLGDTGLYGAVFN